MSTSGCEKENFRKSLDLSDFVSESQNIVGDYRCPLCGGIYLNPLVDTCGHVFCKVCINKHLQTSNKCPISGLPTEEKKMNKIDLLNSILDRQYVYCKNRHFHCEWSGKLMELEGHLNQDCQRQVLSCPHMGCNNSVFREDLQTHTASCEWRIVPCPDCEVQIAFVEIPEHQKVCPRFKLPCPQTCFIYIERQHIESHIQDHCENTVVDCPFKLIGCLTRISRGQLNNYLTQHTNRHQLLVLAHVKNTTDEVSTIVKSTPDYSKQLSSIEEKIKKVELMLAVHIRMTADKEVRDDMDSLNLPIKEDTLPKTSLMSKISPIKDCCQNSKSSFGSHLESPGKLMSRKRQRTDDDNPININKPEKINLMEPEEQKTEENPPPMQCDLNSPLCAIVQEVSKPKESLFDTVNISKGLVVSGTKVTSSSPTKMEHKYVFSNMALNQEKETEWRVVLNVKSTWAAVGICNKETVLANKYRFITNNPNYFNGTFAVSTNGYSWNCQNMAENNLNLGTFPQITFGDTIHFKYSPELKELSFNIPNKLSGKLTNVTPHKSSSLVPCFIFLHSGDEILLETI